MGFPCSARVRPGWLRVPGNARQGGDRPGHCLDYVSGISQPPSTYSLTTCDLTSQELADLCLVVTSRSVAERRTESARSTRPRLLGGSSPSVTAVAGFTA